MFFSTFTDLRPEQCDFDTVCVWEYFQNYEMRLISSLSTNQKENMESDFEENFFIDLITIILDVILHV
jgi:hypothetical protein